MTMLRCSLCLGQKTVPGMGSLARIDCWQCKGKGVVQIDSIPESITVPLKPLIVDEEKDKEAIENPTEKVVELKDRGFKYDKKKK